MARHFGRSTNTDWITMYQNYATDDFCPPSFHLWSGLGILSTACERRMWIDHGRYQVFPNLYILLIARPAVGKSTAITCAVDNVLRNLRGAGAMKDNGIRFLSQQSSEAGFYSPQLEQKKKFYVGNQELTQTPGFMQFGEAGNSLKEISGGGSIMKALTEFYDCPKFWGKSLAGREKPIVVENVYLTMLAACTFVDLPGIIPRANLEGGLASRFIYVPEFDRAIRRPTFKTTAANEVMRQKLVEDLQEIFTLSGEVTVDPEFYPAWTERHADNDKRLNEAPNSQIECLLARRFLTIEKLSLLCSLSESNERVIRESHWVRAEQLYDAQAKLLPRVLESSSIAEDQKTLTEAIIRYVSTGKHTVDDLSRYLYANGLDPFRIKANIDFCEQKKLLVVDKDTGLMSKGVLMNNESDIASAINEFNMNEQSLPVEVVQQ